MNVKGTVDCLMMDLMNLNDALTNLTFDLGLARSEMSDEKIEKVVKKISDNYGSGLFDAYVTLKEAGVLDD